MKISKLLTLNIANFVTFSFCNKYNIRRKLFHLCSFNAKLYIWAILIKTEERELIITK